MAKIIKLKKGIETGYPLTIPQAVINPETGENISEEFTKNSDFYKIDSLRINEGRDYPFINPPAGYVETVRVFNSIVLDVKVYGGDYDTYDYSIVTFYKNHGQNGDGLTLSRRNKSTGTVGRFLFINSESHTSTSPENKAEVSKIDLGGIQQINITDFFGADLEITLNTDNIPEGIFSAGTTGSDWDNHVLSKFSLFPAKINVPKELSKLDSLRINEGKNFPFINPPSGYESAVKTFNEIVLDVKMYGQDFENYDYGIKAFYKGHGTNGDGFILSRRNKSTGTVGGFLFVNSAVSPTSPENKAEVSKIQLGGIQKINLTDFFGGDVDLVINTDKMPAGIFSSGNGNSDWNDHVLDKINIFPHRVDVPGELSRLDSLRVNKGKDYPFATGFTHNFITAINKALLDMKLFGGDFSVYKYTLSGVYKNDSTWGNGIILGRFRPSVRQYLRVRFGGTEASDLSAENQAEVLKLLDGGVQTLQLTDIWDSGMDVEVVIDTDELSNGFTNVGYNIGGEPWISHVITPANYLKRQRAVNEGQIKEYPTFRQAIEEGATGLVKVGSMLATSVVDEVVFPGAGNDYKPSEVWRQYRILNAAGGRPKRSSRLMVIKDEYGNPTLFKRFGKVYNYFGHGTLAYRTKDEYDTPVITHETNQYEKFIIPGGWPDADTTSYEIDRIYELDNGEVLIEVLNGILEPGLTSNSDRRIQLYLTEGLRDAPRVPNENGVLEIDLSGLVTRVHQYKARTTTRSLPTTVSIEGNRIALSPYRSGHNGLVHYSSDYGKTWKVILNMAVDDADFIVPYRGTPGEWPIPTDLNPPMPADMWTAGGNNNHHTHGVTIDPYSNRIYVCTGDAGGNFNGRTAIWFTEDEGLTWTRVPTKGNMMFDSFGGQQFMAVVCTKSYLLAGSDAGRDGLYRFSRSSSYMPEIEAAFLCDESIGTELRMVFSGALVTDFGHVYCLFNPNTGVYDRGMVVFTADGLEFEVAYLDELSDGTSTNPGFVSWGSFLGSDSHGNIYVVGGDYDILVKLS